MSTAKRLIQNISSLYVLQGANYLMPLIVLPYLVRVLGAEKFGLIAFSQALMQYLVMLTDYGFNLTATKKIARNRGEIEKISRVCGNVLTIKTLMLFFSFVILLTIVFGFSKFSQDWKVYLASFVLVVGNAIFPLWYFQGIEQMRLITVLNVIGKTIATIGIFLFVKSQDDVALAAFLQALGFGIIGLLGLFAMFFFGNLKLQLPTFAEIKEEMIDGWHVFLSTAAISIYTASNAFLLGVFTNNTAVGYYSAGDKVVKALNGLAGPLFQSIYPHLNSLLVKSQAEAKKFLQKVTQATGLVTLLISVLTFFFAPLIIHLLFGKDFRPAVTVLRWMSPLPFLVAINSIFGTLTLLTFGMHKSLSRIVMIAGAFNIALTLPLIHLYRAPGAAIAITATEILVLILMIKTLRSKGVFFHFQKHSVEGA